MPKSSKTARQHICVKCNTEFLNRENFRMHYNNNLVAKAANKPQCNEA